MKVDLGLGVSIEIKEVKGMGKVTILDNKIKEGANYRQLFSSKKL